MLLFFLFVAYTARTTLEYWTEGAVIGPGAGYFPFWVCAILSGLTLLWLLQVTISPGEAMPKNFVPSRKRGLLAGLFFINLIFFAAIVRYVGFPVAMFIFVMVIVSLLGKRDLRSIIYYAIYSLAITVFFTFLFGRFLEVSFPSAKIEIFKLISSLIS
jgi:hypothetical protein